MKKVNIPGPAIAGFAIVLVCLCGLLKGTPDSGHNILIIFICGIVFAILVFFSFKSIHVDEAKPVDETRKKPMSKGKAAAQKDSVHMQRMLEIYNDQLDDVRRKSRNGAIYAGVALVIAFLMWGYGMFALTFFLGVSVLCLAYGGWCLFTLYTNSDNESARALAKKLNITTVKDKVEEAETIVWKNEEKVGDTLKVTSYTEEECAISDSGKVIMETERLFLREMSMNDFDALYRVLADTNNMQYYSYTFDEERVRNWISRNMDRYGMDGFGLWAVCLKDTGEMIGDCGLTLQNIDGKTLPEIGYHIRANCQHLGYASEAAMAVRDWAFKNTEFPALYSYCRSVNTPSIKTAGSIGMHYDREYRDEEGNLMRVSVIRKEEVNGIVSQKRTPDD